ncbi:MAG TPA: histidine phosphatase family protein [Pseudomonadales bacterium]|nr:histidine phosphatase family protein [Pseudomonadales bacterium]
MARAFDPDFPYGERTTTLVRRLLERGVTRMSLLLRHSAREYAPGRHDLENPLTDAGRELARAFGQRLAPELSLRAYASPVARCEDTAELIHAAHLQVGGRGGGGYRPVEALGVFYVLDQMKMFKAMSVAREGLTSFVDAWTAGDVPADIMMPAPVAARTLLAMLVARLRSRDASPALDLNVSHDLTLYLMRAQLLGLGPDAGDVLYLDGMLLWEADGEVFVATHDGEAHAVTTLLGNAA